MILRNARAPEDYGTVWTMSLYDLVLLGREIAAGDLTPFGIYVLINGMTYVYGPQGDLYRFEGKREPEIIHLSQYTSKETPSQMKRS